MLGAHVLSGTLRASHAGRLVTNENNFADKNETEKTRSIITMLRALLYEIIFQDRITQSSVLRPGTRENSSVLCVITESCRVYACAAICRS